MKKEVMKDLGNMAEQLAKGALGKSLNKSRISEDTAGSIADSIIDGVTGMLGGGGGGRGGGGRGCSR